MAQYHQPYASLSSFLFVWSGNQIRCRSSTSLWVGGDRVNEARLGALAILRANEKRNPPAWLQTVGCSCFAHSALRHHPASSAPSVPMRRSWPLGFSGTETGMSRGPPEFSLFSHPRNIVHASAKDKSKRASYRFSLV